MDAKTKKTLMYVGIGVGVFLVARHLLKKNEEKSNASGYWHCSCYDKWGNVNHNQRCRKSQHADCESCCGHYNKTATNEGLNVVTGGTEPITTTQTILRSRG